MTQARTHLGQLARRAHLNNEYFILEKKGIPVIGSMDADELEDYLELRDSTIEAQIRQSNRDIQAGRIRSAEALVRELKVNTAKVSRCGSGWPADLCPAVKGSTVSAPAAFGSATTSRVRRFISRLVLCDVRIRTADHRQGDRGNFVQNPQPG